MPRSKSTPTATPEEKDAATNHVVVDDRSISESGSASTSTSNHHKHDVNATNGKSGSDHDQTDDLAINTINNGDGVTAAMSDTAHPTPATEIDMPEKDAPAQASESANHRKTKRSNPTKAELEVMLDEIQTAMSVAAKNHQQKEQELLAQISDRQTQLETQQKIAADRQTQINTLQSELQEYKDYIEKIKTYLEQASKLKDELDRAKQENAQLVETNQELTAALAKAQQAAPQRSTHSTRSARPSVMVKRSLSTKKLPQKQLKPATQDSTSTRPSATPDHSIRREVLNRPVMPNRTAPKINDANIGWVD
jgi:predicted RNase H-like nuclease (RuvC/YqgF family)